VILMVCRDRTRAGQCRGSQGQLRCAALRLSGWPNPRAIWFVAPGSGTGELRGLTGEITYQRDESGAISRSTTTSNRRSPRLLVRQGLIQHYADVRGAAGVVERHDPFFLFGCRSLSDLSPLAGLPSLTSLDLSECSSLSDLNPLTDLSKLQTLYVYGISSKAKIPDEIRTRFRLWARYLPDEGRTTKGQGPRPLVSCLARG
jgi:hypothetical protein